MRLAIVGAGIAGLTAASILSRRHEVTVLEAERHIGGHANTFSVCEGNRSVAVDTGFIVFNEPNYPSLLRLFDRHDVPVQDSDMSFSVHDRATGLEYNGASFDALFAQRKNLLKPRFWGMLADIARFHRDAPGHLRGGLEDSITVSDYVERHRFGPLFAEHYLVPLGASLWSCNAERFYEFPMTFVLEFLDNHHMLQVSGRPVWKTVKGGSCQYVKRLVSEFEHRIRLNAAVAAIRRQQRGIVVELCDGRKDTFDEVILACHADQSIRLVEAIESRERDVLEQFPYQDNEVVLHTDTSLLPSRRKAWASWNYCIPQASRSEVTVTYNMNKLQSLDTSRTYCVSLNQASQIEQRSVITRLKYQHPSFTRGRGAAQDEHARLIRRNGLSYCGAYWGFGFHEDGVRSALQVCAAFDMDLDS